MDNDVPSPFLQSQVMVEVAGGDEHDEPPSILEVPENPNQTYDELVKANHDLQVFFGVGDDLDIFSIVYFIRLLSPLCEVRTMLSRLPTPTLSWRLPAGPWMSPNS